MKTKKVEDVPDVKNSKLLSKFTRLVLETAVNMDKGGIVEFKPDNNREIANLRQGSRAVGDVANYNLAPKRFKWYIRQCRGYIERLE